MPTRCNPISPPTCNLVQPHRTFRGLAWKSIPSHWSHPDPVRARNFTPICVTHLTQADTVFPPSQYQEILHPSERRNFPFPSVICPDMSFCYLPLPIRTLITTSLHTPFMCISSLSIVYPVSRYPIRIQCPLNVVISTCPFSPISNLIQRQTTTNE